MRWARIWGLAGLVGVTAGIALAEPPRTSPRPKMRLVAEQPATHAAPVVAADPSFAPLSLVVRPRRRPDTVAPSAVASQNVTVAMLGLRPRSLPASLRGRQVQHEVLAQTGAAQAPAAQPAEKKGIFGFLRPGKRPEGLAERKLASAAGIRILPGKAAVVSKKGSVCGVPEIKGETLASIPGKLKGCGIVNPVRVTSVSGVRLSTPATINCDTAKALNTWLKNGVEPVYGKGQVVGIEVFASYSCRGRNNKKSARISEHGRGNAIDIGGLTLAGGQNVSVLRNFNKPMRQVHKAACGIFGTTLGPGSDGYHEDHMHFDIARYRKGSYCR